MLFNSEFVYEGRGDYYHERKDMYVSFTKHGNVRTSECNVVKTDILEFLGMVIEDRVLQKNQINGQFVVVIDSKESFKKISLALEYLPKARCIKVITCWRDHDYAEQTRFKMFEGETILNVSFDCFGPVYELTKFTLRKEA